MTGTTRTFGPLHFEDLDPRRFEDLARQLIYDFRPWRALEATGRAGSDDGFVARGFEISDFVDPAPIESADEDGAPAQVVIDRAWLIQCKHEQSITPAKIKRHLENIPDISTDGLYGIIFVAASDFSKTTRDVFRDWCSTRGVSEAHIWGKAELEDQLYQPKNDGLLFAYFGFSLRIHRRSVKTELRTRLAMKRKAERILQKPHQSVLLRDPTEDRYPFLNSEETKAGPAARWRMGSFFGHHPLGIMIEIRRYFAYLSDGCDQWDYVEQSKITPINRRGNPWYEEKKEHTEANFRERHKIWTYWSELPNKNRANYILWELIRYEEILDIDGKGDAVAKIPHIYLENISAREEESYLENSERFNRVNIRLPLECRIKFFPDEFPELPELPALPAPTLEAEP